MGVSTVAYRKYEKGLWVPKFPDMVKLFNHYGYTLQLSKPDFIIELETTKK